ncbi:MAG: hypothetical protein WC880_00530 [Candidatus Paceibacterota bacterium]
MTDTTRKYLEQYDSGDPSEAEGDHISEEQLNTLFPLIGELAVVFNYVEASLDYQIADIVNSRSRQPGYTITAELGNFTKKVLVFRSLYGPAVESVGSPELVKAYGKVVDDLFKVKDIRNDVVHANWMDANSSFEVKLRLMTDENGVFTKTEKMDPAFLRQKIELLNKVWEELEKFSFAWSESF